MNSEAGDSKNQPFTTEGSQIELAKVDEKEPVVDEPQDSQLQDKMTSDQIQKGSNTIMEQIVQMANTPMNEEQGAQTIADHKYLLSNVDNRCAILFFAMTHRNQSLFEALQRHYKKILEDSEVKL